eukprot:TRINITY_DN7566_c0_g1_i4.p2 TRINITY_DN7566_c0_g1~~TRINITY_DN7566_c0_g1_i4.p2  ORF type:complete len:222 (-),score=25.74 TRINITY_DN7566_c0_g1_i4:597-1262(-)
MSPLQPYSLATVKSNPTIAQTVQNLKPCAVKALRQNIKSKPSKSRNYLKSVQCNELNKWADTDGPEENAGLPDNSFYKSTNLTVLRCLTAKAVQKVIMEMQTSDMQVAKWLNKYSAEHPPLQGDDFLLELMGKETIHNPGDEHGHEYIVRPMELANRIIAARMELSKSIASVITDVASERNVAIMRKHLETHSYTSGSWDTEDKRVKAMLDAKKNTNKVRN